MMVNVDGNLPVSNHKKCCYRTCVNINNNLLCVHLRVHVVTGGLHCIILYKCNMCRLPTLLRPAQLFNSLSDSAGS